MTRTTQTVDRIYQLLFEHFGPQGWWPGDGPLEICIGAILTQNTNWNNVERAIANLRAAQAVNVEVLLSVPVDKLAELIRPAGYYNVKARRLRSFLQAVHSCADGRVETFLTGPLDRVRSRLLAIKGIGPETADSMLLYAGGHATFVVDAYTGRILGRHGLIGPGDDYESIKLLMETHLPPDRQLYNEFHALLVATGKHYCRPRSPLCYKCPLEPLDHQVEF